MRSKASAARDEVLIMDTVGKKTVPSSSSGWLGGHAGPAGSGQGVEVGKLV